MQRLFLFFDFWQSGHTGQQAQDPRQQSAGSNHQPVYLTEDRTGSDRSDSRLSHRLDRTNAGGLPPKLPISHDYTSLVGNDMNLSCMSFMTPFL